MNAISRTIVPETDPTFIMEAAATPTPPECAPEAYSSWTEVAAAFEAAVADWEAKEHLHDDAHFAALGRTPTADETAIADASIEGLIRAQNLVRDYVPRSADEYARKARMLLTHRAWETVEVTDILKSDAEELAARAPQGSDELDAAIAALDAFMPTYQAASSAHSDAEEALHAAEDVEVPPPDVLVRISPAFVMKLPAGDATVPETRYVYKTAKAIDESDKLSEDEKAIRRQALASWQEQIEAAERASGLWDLRQAEREADRAYQDALRHVGELGDAILKAPARSPEAIMRKLAAYARSGFYESWRDYAHDEPVIAAVLQDIGAVGVPEPAASIFRSLERELDRLWAIERTQNDASDKELEAATAATRRVADQIMATPAASLADLRVKARAIQWCYSDEGEQVNLDGRTPGQRAATSVEFAEQLIGELLGEAPRGTQPTSMVRDRWETASKAYAVACEAARQNLDDQELSQREYEAFYDLRVALPPDFDALLAKCRLLIGDIGPKTFDDYLHEALDGGDECHLALVYQDLQHLLRCAGRPVPVEPMSFNLRLEMMGTTVRPDYLTEPSAEALEYIGATGVAGLDQIRADAWIREYLEAGGTLHLGFPEKEVLFIGQPLPDTEERVRLRDMVDVKHADLRLAVVALAKERMQARGEVSLGVAS